MATLNQLDPLSGIPADSIDFDALEKELDEQLEAELSGLQFLKEEHANIGNPAHLGTVIQGVVWEQFLNQIAVTAGEDFIEENRGLHLDLRNDAHIQTTENFANGKIATHNTEIDYQQRYDDYQSNFQRDENGNVMTHTTRTGTTEATVTSEARKPFDKNRPSGSAEKGTQMDHTVPAAEIIRDPAANAHLTQDERVIFANSQVNLNEIPADQNASKSDTPTSDWLDNPNSKGQTPRERFDMSPEEEASLRQKDEEARAEYERQKAEGEQRSVEAGKKSQKEEAFRIGKQALRAVLMQLLAELVREIIAKLVKWFQSAQRKLDTLLTSLKEAFHGFVGKMKTHLINAGNAVFTTVLTAIVGPVFSTIKKVWMMLKQGWQSLKQAVAYLRSPENKGKPLGRLLMETGKIVIAGLTGVGALVLGEVVEKSLLAIPIFAVEIPLLGSLANILGIFIGAVVAGIIGAIALHLIEKTLQKSQQDENSTQQADQGNRALALLQTQNTVKEEHLRQGKKAMVHNVVNRHQEAAHAANAMDDALDQLDQSHVATDENLQAQSQALDDLLGGLL